MGGWWNGPQKITFFQSRSKIFSSFQVFLPISSKVSPKLLPHIFSTIFSIFLQNKITLMSLHKFPKIVFQNFLYFFIKFRKILCPGVFTPVASKLSPKRLLFFQIAPNRLNKLHLAIFKIGQTYDFQLPPIPHFFSPKKLMTCQRSSAPSQELAVLAGQFWTSLNFAKSRAKIMTKISVELRARD